MHEKQSTVFSWLLVVIAFGAVLHGAYDHDVIAIALAVFILVIAVRDIVLADHYNNEEG